VEIQCRKCSVILCMSETASRYTSMHDKMMLRSRNWYYMVIVIAVALTLL
jgi:hypothetical protein